MSNPLLTEYKWYGHFENEGKTYVITEPETPRHWYNYFFNDDFVSFTSQVGFGEGLTQDELGRRIMLISNRNIFVCEDDKYFSILGLPMNYGYKNFACAHSIGSTTISQSYNGIDSSVRIFVPNEGRNEFWTISLTNTSDKERTIRLVPYSKTELDEPYKPQGYNFACGGYREDKNAVYGRDYASFHQNFKTQFYGYMSSSEKVSGFDSRRNAFIGPFGDEQHPVALEKNAKCTNSDCNTEKVCLVLENTITLKPGEKKTIEYCVGIAFNDSEFIVPTSELVNSEFEKMNKKYDDILGKVKIETPIEHLNFLMNSWLKYSADMGSRWARVRHNGYRDLTSDTECFAAVDADIAWERMKRVLSYQYENGYAPRTIIGGAIADRKFSDNTVWMTYAVCTIAKELGKKEILLEEVPYNNGKVGTVYEHLCHSVDFLYNFQGLYGLVRIWGGDWNDCVNYAGLKEKGVSIWLSIAFVRAAKMLSEMSKWLGEEEKAKEYKEKADIMADRIEKYGYDEKGGYYIYCRTDDDIIMGSSDCDEGKIFLISQLWSVFAGLDRSAKAMDKAEELLEIDLGIRLAFPAYSYQRPYIGSMSEKMPGVQDNGGVYLHPSAWKLAVDSILRRPDRVEEGIKKIIPSDTSYTVKCGEPYTLYNSYFAPESGYREATPGQSWRTAATSWMCKSMIEYVFGMHPELEGIRIDPCIPLSWKESKITKVFRNCTYNVTYLSDGTGSDVLSITINGKKVEANIIAPVSGEVLDIVVNLGKK